MITTTIIREVMTQNVVTVASTDSIWDIERTFKINHLRHAPVCESGEVVGMISLIDLRRSISFGAREGMASKEVSNLTASHVMASDPVTVQSDQTVKEVALMFLDHEFHAVPVMEKESLVGIISTTDVIHFLINSIGEWEEDSMT